MRAALSVQCTAPNGQTGDFLTDIESGEVVSPIFMHLSPLFDWTNENGWERAPRDPKYPVGVYEKESA